MTKPTTEARMKVAWRLYVGGWGAIILTILGIGILIGEALADVPLAPLATAFLVGAFVGANVGVLIMAVMHVASTADDWDERDGRELRDLMARRREGREAREWSRL